MNKILTVKVTECGDNCYLLFSAVRRPHEETMGEYLVKTLVSFLYDAGDVAAEWEPQYGPIQVWRKGDKETGKPHYFYEYIKDTPLNWSQLAVKSASLPEAAVHCDWQYIFNVLKDFAS